MMPPKPLTPLEARCCAALDAFQNQHGRLPTHRELATAADVRRPSDILYRLVCKGWLASDKLPAPESKPAKVVQRTVAKPTRPKFVPKRTKTLVSAALVREIRNRLAVGMPAIELRRECGVQHGQLQKLFENGRSLRLSTLDRLCGHLGLRLVPMTGEREPYEHIGSSEAVRKAIVDVRESGATLAEICRAAKVPVGNVGAFLSGRRSLNLKTVDALCSVLGLELGITTQALDRIR